MSLLLDSGKTSEDVGERRTLVRSDLITWCCKQDCDRREEGVQAAGLVKGMGDAWSMCDPIRRPYS